MSLSINTTVPSAPSTESTPMSNTLNDDDEVELMLVNSPATTIRELHDRAAASGNVISLESPGAPPPPPLQHEGRSQGGGEGEGEGEGGEGKNQSLKFARGGMFRSETPAWDSSNGAARSNTVEHRVLTNGLTLQEYQQMLIDARILDGGGGGLLFGRDEGSEFARVGMARSETLSFASTSAWDSSIGAARTNTVEHRVLTNKSKGKKSTSKSKRKKSKAKTEKGLKSAKSDKGTKSTKASKSDTSNKGTTSTKESKSDKGTNAAWEVFAGFMGAVLFPCLLFSLKDLWNKKSDKSTKDSNSEYQPKLSDAFACTVLVVLLLLPLYSLNIISKVAAIISFYLWMGLNVLVFLDGTDKEKLVLSNIFAKLLFYHH